MSAIRKFPSDAVATCIDREGMHGRLWAGTIVGRNY